MLNCRAEGTCGHERSLAFDGDAERDRQIVDLRVKEARAGRRFARYSVARCLTFTGRYGDWRDERDREGHFHLIRACFIEAAATFRVSLELNRSRQQQQRTRAQLQSRKGLVRPSRRLRVPDVDDASKNSKSLFRFFTLKTSGLSPSPVICPSVRRASSQVPSESGETQLHRLRPSEDPAIGILVENLQGFMLRPSTMAALNWARTSFSRS